MQAIRIARLFEPLYKKHNINSSTLYRLIKIKYEGVQQTFLGDKRLNIFEVLFGYFPFILSSYIAYTLINPIGDFEFNLASSLFVTSFFIAPMMMISLSLIVFDNKDLNLLIATPIDLRIITLARAFLLLEDFLTMLLLLVAIPTLATITSYGIFFSLAYFISAAIYNFSITLIVLLIFNKFLRVANRDRLKKIVTSVQLLLTLSMIVAFQFISEFIHLSQQSKELGTSTKYLLPSYWYTALINIVQGRIDALNIFSSITTITLLLSLLYQAKKLVLNDFELNLLKNKEIKVKEKKIKKKKDFYPKIIFRSKNERIVFQKANKIFAKEGKFKVSVIINVVMATIFPLIFIFKDFKSFGGLTGLQQLPIKALAPNFFIVIIYFISMEGYVKFTESPKANWVYDFLPVDKIDIYLGASKALFFKTIGIILGVHSLFLLSIYGVAALLPIVFYTSIAILVYIVSSLNKDDFRVFYLDYNALQGKEKKKVFDLIKSIKTLLFIVPSIVIFFYFDNYLMYSGILLNFLVTFVIYKLFLTEMNKDRKKQIGAKA